MPIGQPTRHLLRGLEARPTETWGYVIYRTTYTPVSDRVFPLALQTIHHHIRKAVLYDRAEAREILGVQDPLVISHDLLWPRYSSIIMDNCDNFNAIPLSSVRSHFESWMEGREREEMDSRIEHGICLAIDDEVLRAFADARARIPAGDGPVGADDALVDVDKLDKWCVKTVEAWPELDEADDDYDGVMKARVRSLWDLWQRTTDRYPVAYLRREEDGVFEG